MLLQRGQYLETNAIRMDVDLSAFIRLKKDLEKDDVYRGIVNLDLSPGIAEGSYYMKLMINGKEAARSDTFKVLRQGLFVQSCLSVFNVESVQRPTKNLYADLPFDFARHFELTLAGQILCSSSKFSVSVYSAKSSKLIMKDYLKDIEDFGVFVETFTSIPSFAVYEDDIYIEVRDDSKLVARIVSQFGEQESYLTDHLVETFISQGPLQFKRVDIKFDAFRNARISHFSNGEKLTSYPLVDPIVLSD
jgi:hypothetical protein